MLQMKDGEVRTDMNGAKCDVGVLQIGPEIHPLGAIISPAGARATTAEVPLLASGYLCSMLINF